MFEAMGGEVGEAPEASAAGSRVLGRTAGTAEEVRPVGSSPREGALVRLQAVQALEASRSAAWAALLRQVADLVDDMAATAGPAAPVAGVARAASTGLDADLATEAAAAEVAVALVVPLGRAHAVVHEALALCTHLPVTMAALETGRVDPARARVVVDETLMLPDAQAAAVDAQLEPDLGPLTAPQLRARVRHLVATTDPAAVRRRTRRATCERGVRLFPAPDGMAQLVATGPGTDLATVFDRLTTSARARQGTHGRVDPHAATAAGLDPLALPEASASLPDRRGMDARRFDALVDLATTGDLPTPGDVAVAGTGDAAPDDAGTTSAGRAGRAGTGGAGQPHGPQVVVALTSLLGLDQEPAQLAGQGPVPVEQVRELLAAGHRFRRALTHPLTGQLLGLDGHLMVLDPLAPAEDRGVQDTGDQGRVEDTPTTRRVGPPPPTRQAAPPPEDRQLPLAPDDDEAAPAGLDRPPPDQAETPPRRALRLPSRRYCPVLAAGGGSYAPTAACDRFVRARSPRCQAPGCRMPATRCDLDHRRTHATGGPTCPCNLDVLCRRHHLAKHHHGWTTTPLSDDARDTTLRWTSPVGQTVDVPAEPLLPRPGTPPTGSSPRTDDDHLPARYPRGDGAVHDTARLHHELARHQDDARSAGDDAQNGDRSPDLEEPPPF